jgi:hypothetical protein
MFVLTAAGPTPAVRGVRNRLEASKTTNSVRLLAAPSRRAAQVAQQVREGVTE